MVVTGLYGVDNGVQTVVTVVVPVEVATQKPLYQFQYAASSAALQVSWMHLDTLSLPQRDASEVTSFSAKQLDQQESTGELGVADGVVDGVAELDGVTQGVVTGPVDGQ